MRPLPLDPPPPPNRLRPPPWSGAHRRRWTFAFGLVAAAFAGEQGAAACSVAWLQHELDPQAQAPDKIAPKAVTRASAVVTRRGRGGSIGSCDDLGFIELTLGGATDDRTPVEKLGYLVQFDGGTLPTGYTLPRQAARLQGDKLFLAWVDGASLTQEAFDFTLRVVTVDLAGNVSPPSAAVMVSHPGGSGCSLGGLGAAGRGSGARPLLLALLAFAAIARRRRRRARAAESGDRWVAAPVA